MMEKGMIAFAGLVTIFFSSQFIYKNMITKNNVKNFMKDYIDADQ
jgi:hypothetical protein